MKLRIAGYERESVVDGPGIRFVIFAQGCPHRCKGCHNPETWDFSGGREVTEEELLSIIKATKLLSGVTFSGGEPFAQARAFASLAEKVKGLGLDIVTYTGYTFEEILEMAQHDPDKKRLLELSDLLVDGPYIEKERDISLPFRGSRNQRLIAVKDSLALGRAVVTSI
ncbi:MAG: anaerobic ribonucleoside-triphosphate reductase activating protein [Thermacetogenium sp.]|jgi:anaerobic ribonucleoside-triphosphate reductase activating protein|uniref:Anaerobic ribonucleoside-triphosphate reductase-activating protein n=1 Tax=Thermacetogenium phaeum TaxID=85874 RepID=A0A124FKG5_9THEO|nr:MAG: Anaerobic ribonucleoside-triphosphate reductase-activating protein [Thermacetogenium phaeum]MDN5376105.1 anaerobic ribonucleoside-triphosphate reductase activating protein [Thermacetogenium sp.]